MKRCPWHWNHNLSRCMYSSMDLLLQVFISNTVVIYVAISSNCSVLLQYYYRPSLPPSSEQRDEHQLSHSTPISHTVQQNVQCFPPSNCSLLTGGGLGGNIVKEIMEGGSREERCNYRPSWVDANSGLLGAKFASKMDQMTWQTRNGKAWNISWAVAGFAGLSRIVKLWNFSR